jgi:hypothetical protein
MGVYVSEVGVSKKPLGWLGVDGLPDCLEHVVAY